MNFPTHILNCDSYSLTLLDLFPFSDTSAFSTMAFPPLGNSDHVEASGAIDFPSNSKGDAPFHRIIYHYSQADLESLIDHFHGRISLNCACAAASEFCGWFQVGTVVYIPHHKNRVKPHLSP